MYEGFSGQARKAIQLAYEEARRRRHDYVGTEHVLFGVLRKGAAAALLAAAGVEAEAVYRASARPAAGQRRGDVGPAAADASRQARLEAAREEAAAWATLASGRRTCCWACCARRRAAAAQALLALGLTAEGLRAEAAKRPQPENRDWMLRPEPRPGDPPRGDPTAGDLAERVSPDVLPPRRASQAIGLSPAPLRCTPERPDARANRRHPVPARGREATPGVAIPRRLRRRQSGRRGDAGRPVGRARLGTRLGRGRVRSGIVGGIAGAAAGVAIGWTLSCKDPVCYLSGGLAGARPRRLLGDCRRLPRAGQRTRVRRPRKCSTVTWSERKCVG